MFSERFPGETSGFWTSVYGSYPEVTAALGDQIAFRYSVAHNVMKIPDAYKFDECDFADADELASRSHGNPDNVAQPASGGTANVFLYTVTETDVQAEAIFFACVGVDVIGGHCGRGQKVRVNLGITEQPSGSSTSSPPPMPLLPIATEGPDCPEGCQLSGQRRMLRRSLLFAAWPSCPLSAAFRCEDCQRSNIHTQNHRV